MIDGGIFLGRNPITGRSYSKDAIISSLEEHGDASALVTSYKALYYDDIEGNEEIFAFAEQHPTRLVSCPVISPHRALTKKGDYGIQSLIDRGSKLLGVFFAPNYYEPDLESSTYRKMLQTTADAGMTILFGIRNKADLHAVVSLASELPTQVLIRWMNGRAYYYLNEIITTLAQSTNVHFELSNVCSAGGIKLLVDECGSDRFFYASGVPEHFPLVGKYMLFRAGLSEPALTDILHNTLAQNLGQEQISSTPPLFLQEEQEKVDRIEASQKIDTHWHLGGWNLVEPRIEPHMLLEDAASFRIEKAVASPTKSLNHCIQEGNAEMARFLEGDTTDIFRGYIVIHPFRVEESLEEIAKYADHPKMVGLKTIQDLYGITLHHPGYKAIIEGAPKGLPMLAHIPGMGEMAAAFPDQLFIAAHSTWERVKHLIDQSNIYFDLTTSHNDIAETSLRTLITKAGIQRILFGSDAQLIDPAWTLGKLLSEELTEKEERAILYENGKALFGFE